MNIGFIIRADDYDLKLKEKSLNTFKFPYLTLKTH